MKARWPGKSFWVPALGKQGGVALLVSQNSRFEATQWQRDSSGRIISVLALLDDIRFNFVNIYAPAILVSEKASLIQFMSISFRIPSRLLGVILIALKAI